MTRRRVTGLLVPLEAAVPLVEPWLHLVPETSRELPPHVTVLWPFLPPDEVDAAVEDELAALFAAEEPFDVLLGGFGSFPDAFYLTPAPAARFRALTELVWGRWPECPPFAGAFDEVVPHLTVALDPDAPSIVEMERAIGPRLPLAARAERVLLAEEGEDGVSRLRCAFALGADGRAGGGAR